MTRLHAFPNFGKPAGWADRRRDASRQGRTSCSSVRSMLRGTSSPALMIESQGRAAEQQDTDKVGPSCTSINAQTERSTVRPTRRSVRAQAFEHRRS